MQDLREPTGGEPTGGEPIDGEIVAQVLAGEVDRFALLVFRYEGPLRRVAASRLGRADWAEDVVQDTFLAVLKSLASYDSRYSFRTWLWAILLNQCHRHHRRRQRRPQVRPWSDAARTTTLAGEGAERAAEEQLASRQPSPDMRLLAQERADVLQSLLAQLPEPQADALRLRFYGELKFQEIADVMNCGLSTAKARVRWGLTKLSTLLNDASLHLEGDR